MKSASLAVIIQRAVAAAALLLVFSYAADAKGIAILAPDATGTSLQFRAVLESSLAVEFEIIDAGLARAVFDVQKPSKPYNMTLLEARNLGTGIGCSYFVLIRSDTIRRNSLEKRGYFESYAAIFFVNARTGQLLDWHLSKSEANSSEKAAAGLMKIVPEAAKRIGLKSGVEPGGHDEWNPVSGQIDETELGDDTRLPLPYRRIKPPYTEAANLYGIEATVDILVEIDKNGKVTGTRIERWAGFGLDESVEETVREMQWRPADGRDGTFTTRVLLRYNFRDIADETK